MNLEFRKLRADEIECRVGSCKNNYITLLLYIDSRAAVDLLNETVGPMNWQTEFTQCGDLTIGKLGIWDEDKSQWIWKSDVGEYPNNEKKKGKNQLVGESDEVGETKSNAYKGMISDCYKRMLSRWGVQELYSAPKITLYNGNKYEKYNVNSINIDDNRTITQLSIVDSKGNIVFTWAKGQPQQQQYVPQQQYIPQQTNDVEEMNCVVIPKVKPQPQQNYTFEKIANPINEKGYLEPPMFKQIVKCKNMPELKNIWSIYPELHNNKYFKDTVNKRKGELEKKEQSLLYIEN